MSFHYYIYFNMHLKILDILLCNSKVVGTFNTINSNYLISAVTSSRNILSVLNMPFFF